MQAETAPAVTQEVAQSYSSVWEHIFWGPIINPHEQTDPRWHPLDSCKEVMLYAALAGTTGYLLGSKRNAE